MDAVQLKAFYHWAQDGHAHALTIAYEKMNHVCEDFSIRCFTALRLSPEFTRLFEVLEMYCATDRGPPASFWDSYIDLVAAASVHTCNKEGELGSTSDFLEGDAAMNV